MAKHKRKLLRVVTALLVTLLTASGAYITLDANDIVPGFVTLSPLQDTSRTFPPFASPPAPPATVGGLAALDPNAPMPQASAVAAAAAKLAADGHIGPHSGILVADGATGTVLADHSSSGQFTPASVAKVVTAFGALNALDRNARLATRVVQQGNDIVLVGGGDVMLAADKGNPHATNGHAGLGDLADKVVKQLKASNVTSVSLGFDDTFFAGPAISPESDPGNVPGGYIAPVTAMEVNIGKKIEGDYPPRWDDPSLQTAQTFAAALTQRGIAVTATAATAAPAGATEIARVESARIGEIVEYFLHTSDNTVTEAMCRIVASHKGLPTSFAGGTQAVLGEVSAVGIDTSGARLSDCSGLGDNSHLSPQMLVELVRYVSNAAHPKLRFLIAALPIGALEGTLDERFHGSNGAGTVRAKTGSLPKVDSLAGIVMTVDNRLLVFAVMADQVSASPAQARQAIDTFVGALAGCGCR